MYREVVDLVRVKRVHPIPTKCLGGGEACVVKPSLVEEIDEAI